MRQASCLESRARRRADGRRGHPLCEADAFRCQTVNVRRADVLPPVASKVTVPEVILSMRVSERVRTCVHQQQRPCWRFLLFCISLGQGHSSRRPLLLHPHQHIMMHTAHKKECRLPARGGMDGSTQKHPNPSECRRPRQEKRSPSYASHRTLTAKITRTFGRP